MSCCGKRQASDVRFPLQVSEWDELDARLGKSLDAIAADYLSQRDALVVDSLETMRRMLNLLRIEQRRGTFVRD
jgi:hypothetical protein